MPLKRQFKETVQARIRQSEGNPFREGVESLLAGDLDTGNGALFPFVFPPLLVYFRPVSMILTSGTREIFAINPRFEWCLHLANYKRSGEVKTGSFD
jgi:hypothetical protein